MLAPVGTCHAPALARVIAPARIASMRLPPDAKLIPTVTIGAMAMHAGPAAAQAASWMKLWRICDFSIALNTLPIARNADLKKFPIDLNSLLKKKPEGSVNDSGLFST